MGCFEDKPCIRKGKIKKGATVWQDHGFMKWDKEEALFDVHDDGFIKGRKTLIADGYGNLKSPNMYGNGSIFAKDEDIIMLSDEEMKLSHYDHEKDLIRSQDLADYYEQIREDIEEDVKNALELLNPYNGKLTYRDRLMGFALTILEISEHAEELSHEF